MTLAVQVVGTNYIQQAWPVVRTYIESALASEDFPAWSDSYNIEHVRGFVTSGQWILVVVIDENLKVHGCATISFMNYPLHRVAFITTIGGKLIASRDTFNQLKAILRELGATKIQGFGKPSIVRLWRRFNFEPRTMLVESPL
jgi:hypothetical protein